MIGKLACVWLFCSLLNSMQSWIHDYLCYLLPVFKFSDVVSALYLCLLYRYFEIWFYSCVIIAIYLFIFQMHQWFLSFENKNSSNFWRGPYHRTRHLLSNTGKCQWPKFCTQSCAKKPEWGRYCCQLWAKVAIRSAQMGRKLLRVSLQTRT